MKTLNHEEQLVAMSRENDALVNENRQLRGYVAELEAKQHELESNAFAAWQREMKAVGEVNELRDKLSKLGQWQPIETAPFSTRILLAWYGGLVPHWEIVIGSLVINPEFKRESFWDGFEYRPLDRVTHWTPLPEPPKEAKEIAGYE